MTEQVLARANQLLRAPAASRLFSLFLASAIAIVFGLAALVAPSPTGHGTHLQLGLGQCTFLQATGWPCPMCGATTTFSLMAHLRPLDALANQPFAACLFLLSAAVLAVSVSEVIDPRGRWKAILRRIEPVESVLAVFFLAAMGVGWAYKAWTWGG